LIIRDRFRAKVRFRSSCLIALQATQGSAACLQTGNAGNTSEDEVDEASYGQHDNRRNGKKPKHPKLLSILIGALIVAERREHRDLL
jgi:hypothetical protein